MFDNLNSENWIQLYIYWELSLIKNLGYEISFLNSDNPDFMINDKIKINNKSFQNSKNVIQ